MNERDDLWMQTVSGRRFHILRPEPSEVDIGDIAHALSMICRFGGHTVAFYSVAEHSVRVSRCMDDRPEFDRADKLGALLHDASEAYLGDVIWPLKRSGAMSGYRHIEERVERVVAQAFRLRAMHPAVKYFDLVMLATEKRDLLSEHHQVQDRTVSKEASYAAGEHDLGGASRDSEWVNLRHITALRERIPSPCWPPEFARSTFLARFDALIDDDLRAKFKQAAAR